MQIYSKQDQKLKTTVFIKWNATIQDLSAKLETAGFIYNKQPLYKCNNNQQ